MKLWMLVTGRRGKYLIALLAVAIAGALATQGGKLAEVVSSDPAAALPSGAESVAALRATSRFESADVTPAVVVYRRDGGLTPADRARVQRDRAAIDGARLRGAAPVAPQQISRDRTSALLAVPLTGSDPQVVAAVEAIREQVTRGGGGLAVAVTGPAGFAADIVAVFEGANANLLLATGALVLVLLLLIYRSPIFWLIPFFTVVLAEAATRGASFFLGDAGLDFSDAEAGITSVLVFGAATDYALLLVARYREELQRHEDTHAAMLAALRSAGPAIVASGLTVVVALLTLLLADVGSTRALGPLGATGVAVSMVLSLTLLPATLLIAGRGAFWPRIPRAGELPPDPVRGIWGRIGGTAARAPRRVWAGCFVLLAVLALGLVQLNTDLSPSGDFRGEVEAVDGQELLARAFPAGAAAGVDVVVPDPARAERVTAALRADASLVAGVAVVERGEAGVLLSAALAEDPFGPLGARSIPSLRETAKRAGGPEVLVGGQTAEAYDLRESSGRDNKVVVPVVLALVSSSSWSCCARSCCPQCSPSRWSPRSLRRSASGSSCPRTCSASRASIQACHWSPSCS